MRDRIVGMIPSERSSGQHHRWVLTIAWVHSKYSAVASHCAPDLVLKSCRMSSVYTSTVASQAGRTHKEQNVLRLKCELVYLYPDPFTNALSLTSMPATCASRQHHGCSTHNPHACSLPCPLCIVHTQPATNSKDGRRQRPLCARMLSLLACAMPLPARVLCARRNAPCLHVPYPCCVRTICTCLPGHYSG